MLGRARDQWNYRHFLLCTLVAMGTMSYSYPASVIATTLAQPTFYSYMNLVNSEGEASSDQAALIGAMAGVFQAGGVFGIFITTYIMDRWGRKAGMIFCSLVGLVGGALVCAAQNTAMFIAFKFVAGLSSWGLLSITPVYTAELAPPALRGLFVGMDGFGIALGTCLANYMGIAFFDSTNSSTQWRGPYGVGLIIVSIPLLAVYLAPQSPRWLLLQGRTEDAKAVVRNLHQLSKQEEHHFAMAEFYQMQKQSEYDRTLNPSYWQMFKRRSYRKRVILTVGYCILGQSTALLVINVYGPILYGSLGYSTEQQLTLQAGWVTMGILGNLTGAFILDKIGRRPLMIFGIAGCLVCLTIYTALLAEFASPTPAVPNKAGLRACVAALYLFVFCYGCGVDVAGFVFFGEVYPNHLRAKGLALSVAGIALSSLIYVEVAPTAIAEVGWKYFLVFICICTVGLLLICIYLSETKGLPLEEVAKLFGDQDEVIVFADNIELDATNDDGLIIKNHQEQNVGMRKMQDKEATAHHEVVDL